MRRRQSMPAKWLILADPEDESSWDLLPQLDGGTGVLLVGKMTRQTRRFSRKARNLRLTVASEQAGEVARVHNIAELRQALLRNVPLILLSPMFPTRSHPDWKPIPRMRAAALARLADRPLIALGGMDAKRYRAIAKLGFIGWAGISAFRT